MLARVCIYYALCWLLALSRYPSSVSFCFARSLGVRLCAFLRYWPIYCSDYVWLLGFPNPKLGCPPFAALYRLSVRQYPEFAKDFLQIPGHPGHPCPSLILPVTSAYRRFTLPCTKPCPTHFKLNPFRIFFVRRRKGKILKYVFKKLAFTYTIKQV